MIYGKLQDMAESLVNLSETYGSLAKSLDELRDLHRLQIEALASRFDIPGFTGLSDKALLGELEDRANEHRRNMEERASLPVSDGQLRELKDAVRQADEALDFIRVDALLAQITAVEREVADEALKRVEAARETALEAVNDLAASLEARAKNALVLGRAEDAFTHFSAAADSFQSVDALEPARRRILRYFGLLREHGMRYGGSGLALAEALLRPVLNEKLKNPDAWLWAAGQNALAIALSEQGERSGGEAGSTLLTEAVTAYRNALRVYTEKAHPVQWATTQNNLGNALGYQGERSGGKAGGTLLAEAVSAHRNALRVCTEKAHPVDWATTQNNLGAALQEQGSRSGGEAGVTLLAEAVTAYRNALRVRTEKARPVSWATTQNNLGTALKEQGIRSSGEAGATLLAEAVTAYRNALRVSTEKAHSVHWAATQINLAVAKLAIADHDATGNPEPHLRRALEHVGASLRVYDPEHMPYDYGTASKLRDHLKRRLAGA